MNKLNYYLDQIDKNHNCGREFFNKLAFPIRGKNMVELGVMWCSKCGRILAGHTFGILPMTYPGMENIDPQVANEYFADAQDEINKEVQTQVFMQQQLAEADRLLTHGQHLVDRAMARAEAAEKQRDDLRVELEQSRETLQASLNTAIEIGERRKRERDEARKIAESYRDPISAFVPFPWEE